MRHVYNGWEIERVARVATVGNEIRCLCCNHLAVMDTLQHAGDCSVAQRALRLGRFPMDFVGDPIEAERRRKIAASLSGHADPRRLVIVEGMRHFYDGHEIEAVSTAEGGGGYECWFCQRVASHDNIITHASVCMVASKNARLQPISGDAAFRAADRAEGLLAEDIRRNDFEAALAAHAKAAKTVGETSVMLEDAQAELDTATERLRAAFAKGKA